MPPITQNQLRPFLSALFLQAPPSGKSDAGLAQALLQEIKQLIKKKPSNDKRCGTVARDIVFSSKVTDQIDLQIATIVYSQTNSPAWTCSTALRDTVHHHVVITVLGSLVAIVASDAQMRDTLTKGITNAALIDRKTISEAFIGPEAKSIWLSGIHPSTSVKADSKVLRGSALEYALDPLGDQTYALTAIRSQPTVAGLNQTTRKAIIGTAPSSGRVWLGRARDWNYFLQQIQALLKHLQKQHKRCNHYQFLSEPQSSLKGVTKAYGMAAIPSNMLDEDTETSQEARQNAQRWIYESVYEVKGKQNPDLEVTIYLDGTFLGTIDLKVSSNASGLIKLSPTWKEKNAALDQYHAAFRDFVADSKNVKIYYDSGHAVADGACFIAGWTDHLLDWDFKDFTGYNVGQEKPTRDATISLADQIDISTSNPSLFCYVRHELFKTGWLACDDGAMELADFIHLDPDTGRITLIHVKGSGSITANREVSVSDYEVVVSQGVKNIRHLTPSILAAALEQGNNKDIARAVWFNGKKQPSRSGMISAIRKLPHSTPRALLILQPRLTKSEYNRCLSKTTSANRKLRFRQLNALMLSARIAAMAAGAEFKAIAAK